MYVLSIAMERALSDLTPVERGVAGANALAVAMIVANTAATFMIELGCDQIMMKKSKLAVQKSKSERCLGDGWWRVEDVKS